MMCRGDRQEAIFKDDKDRRMFLETLGEACERSGVRIYSYVLMRNHYHLLMKTPEGNLVACMTWFQSTYTARYNARHRERGHLFQGRYKAIPVEEGDGVYGRTVSDYIHLNPARAGIVNEEKSELKGYRWSSFPILCGEGEAPDWLEVSAVVEWHHWKQSSRRDRRAYENYLQNRAEECWGEEKTREKDDMLESLRRGWYLGCEVFRDTLCELAKEVVKGKCRESYAGNVMRGHDEAEAEKLLLMGLERLGLTREGVRTLKQSDARKQGMAWLIKSKTVVNDAWIQTVLAMGDRSNVSRAVSAYRREGGKDIKKWKKILHVCTD